MSDAAKKLETLSAAEVFKPFEHFSRVMLDAYCVVDEQGHVIKSNQLFAKLVGKKSRQILKAGSFDELLTLAIDNNPLTIKDMLQYISPTRIDEVSGNTDHSSDLNLIVGIYPLKGSEDADSPVGAFILIRDVTAETNLQDKYKHTAMKSITDPLTGLFTRNYFEDYLELHTNTMKAMGPNSDIQELSLIMVDIDFFKRVNDDFGHQAGDYVLKIVGQVMKKSFRKTDVICRYGGEEFLVILPSTDLMGAGLAAEKLRMSVEKENVVFEGKSIPITISAGVGELDVHHENYMETMARADAALYQSKKDGRNRISLHDGSGIKKGPKI